MIDKFETCQNCPDRKLYYHNDCKGYLYRRKNMKKYVKRNVKTMLFMYIVENQVLTRKEENNV